MAETSLLTPRGLLTALFNSLSTATPRRTGNPLRNLSTNDRSLLTTLHVLFPTPILLPALDLLDRQLVTRIIQATPSADPIQAVRPEIHPLESDPALANDWKRGNYFYVVTSAADIRGKSNSGHVAFTPQGQGGEQTYIVRTEAWSCCCAAFTFSAFPAGGPAFSLAGKLEASSMEQFSKGMDGEVKEELWEFGSMSNNGIDGGVVPCCKHLLACVLAERWEGVLGQYVIERRLSREDMAGIVAGI